MAVQLQNLLRVCQEIDSIDPELEIEGKLRADLNKALQFFPKIKKRKNKQAS